MLQTTVAQLYEDNRERLTLTWVCGEAGNGALIRQDPNESAAFIGHLNLIHPNRIQVVGPHEEAHIAALDVERLGRVIERSFTPSPAALILADGVPGHPGVLEFAQARNIAVLASPLPAPFLIDKLRRYLAKTLAESTERHGVLMDVLGLGVLITGDSGSARANSDWS